MPAAIPTAPAVADAFSEWGIERLDLPAYLDRVGYARDLEATAATLTALHRAHIDSIPFENLDLMLGRSIGLDLETIQSKLVARRRGGYCYEHGLLFAAALERLGYRVQRLLARIGHDAQRPRPRTHMILQVSTGTESWLADVGFGAGLLEPLAWPEGGIVAPVHYGGWSHRVVTEADGVHQLQERARAADDWTALYSFTREGQRFSDVMMANYYTSTHPESPFRRRPVVMCSEPERRRRLVGRRLETLDPDGRSAHRELADSEVAGVLRRDFGVHLDRAETAALLGTLPATAASSGWAALS